VAVADCRPQRFPHTAADNRALVRFCREAAPDDVLHFCLEATGVYGRSLAVQLLEDGADVRVSIVNPAQIAAFGRAQLRRTKTDAVDAQVILAFARSQNPLPWTPEPGALRELTQLMREADAIRGTRAQWSNRQQTHAWDADRPDAVRDVDQAVLDTLDCELECLEDAISELCKRDSRLRRQVTVLSSIPGIGRHSAIGLLAYGKRALTNYSAKQLTAHAGLAPGHRLSGTSVRGRSHLAKQGNADLRRVLYMPALVASQHNPALIPVYQRLRKAGKPGKVAIAACMRRLLLIARALLKEDRTFEQVYARS